MTSLPEQFQAARQNGLDQQFSFLRAFGDGVLDRTSRVFALNLDVSRAAVEHSSSTMRQLLALRDPRDLLTIGAQSQRQLRTVFDYGHELFNIAAGLRGAPLRTVSVDAAVTAPALLAPMDLADAAATVAEKVENTVSATVLETASATEAVTEAFTEAATETVSAAPAEAAIETLNETLNETVTETVNEPVIKALTEASDAVSEPAAVSVSAADIVLDTDPVVTSDIAPPVEPTPIAKATSEILDLPLAPPHPVAASVPVDVDVEIELPKVEPVDATPPVAAPAGGGPKVTELRGARGRKKGSGGSV